MEQRKNNEWNIINKETGVSHMTLTLNGMTKEIPDTMAEALYKTLKAMGATDAEINTSLKAKTAAE